MTGEDEPTDIALFERWVAGDRQSGSRLFDRHFDAVNRFFASKVDAQLVADLVGETMLGCIESAPRFRGDAPFRGFLLGVARYVLINFFKRKQRRSDLVFDATVSSLLDLGPSPTRVRSQREELQLLHDALRRLPLDLQLLVEMHYWEGLSTQELASIWDVPQGTIKSRLRRARERLGELIAEVGRSGPGVESTTAHLERWVRELRDEVAPE